MIEPGLALQCRLAAGNPVPGQGHRQERVAHGTPFAQRAPAAPGTFEIAGGEVDALGDGAVDLGFVERAQLGGGDRRAEDAEHRPGVETARHDRRDELGGHPLHDLVAGGDRGQQRPARSAGRLGRGQRRRQDRRAGVGQHAEGVPLAAGKDRLGIDKGGPGLAELGAAAQHRRRTAAAGFLFLHQRQCLPARRHPVRHQRRGERLQGYPLGAVDHRRRQIIIFEVGDKGGKFPAQRHGGFLADKEFPRASLAQLPRGPETACACRAWR